MNSEYSMLREEILLSMKTIKNYNNLLYTSTAALLAFAFKSFQSYLFLLPFVVIFPLYFLIKREMMQVMRIGAYILVFVEEDTEINWERRLNTYDTIFNKNKHKFVPLNAYFGVSILCVFLSALNLNYQEWDISCLLCLIAQIMLAIISVILFIIVSPNYIKMKDQYIKEWIEIKRVEKQNIKIRK